MRDRAIDVYKRQALKTYLYENDNLVEEAGWSTSSSYIHLLDTKKRAVSGDIRVEGEYKF